MCFQYQRCGPQLPPLKHRGGGNVAAGRQVGFSVDVDAAGCQNGFSAEFDVGTEPQLGASAQILGPAFIEGCKGSAL